MIQKKINRKLLKKLRKKYQLEKYKEKFQEFSSLSYSATAEKDKLIVQINHQNEKIYNIKNQISVYSSLGFKNTKKNIIEKY